MAKMDEAQLLNILQTKEDDASSYVWGQLGQERESAMRQYHRLPYGNEEEGWSQIVTSDIQDTVEWILPDLLDVFCSTDKAVVFEPSKPEDVKGAEQATDAVNYVFHKQNNGFMTLYTAFKDALIVRNAAIMWRKETKTDVQKTPFQGATPDVLAMLEAEGYDIDIQGKQVVESPVGPVEVATGTASIKKEREVIKVEAFEPENLLVDRRWTSPLLQDAPYVCRMVEVTLSELWEMGYEDVTAEELGGSDGASFSADHSFRLNKIGQSDAEFAVGRQAENDADDPSLTKGWLRIEFVRVDFDGDGVAELRCVYRVSERVLKNDPISHIPIATTSPVINTHRWDGMSIADAVGDLQLLHTELMRQSLNSLYLANNPRTKVLTDANWSPLANIDDLLDSRPGGLVRQRDPNAVIEHVTPYVGQQAMPMLEYLQGMRENRTGVTRYNQGLDADSLNKTASGIKQIKTAGQQRVKLIARIFAETLIKPCMQGILKLLTDGGMEQLSFRLRGEFVQYDPNEWRDSYDTTINVGLGTGDRDQQMMYLQQILGQQMTMIQGGLGNILVTEKQVYNSLTRMVEAAGYKNTGDFWTNPEQAPKSVQQKKQEQSQSAQQQMQQQFQMELGKIQAKAQADAQLFQQKLQLELEKERLQGQIKMEELRANLELQAANDDRDAQREAMKAQYEARLQEVELELKRYQIDADNQTRITVAQINHSQPAFPV